MENPVKRASGVVFYTRPSCPLCDEARERLRKAGVEFEEVNVTGDRGLEGEYGLFVPVVEVDGRVVFEAGMELEQLSEAIG